MFSIDPESDLRLAREYKNRRIARHSPDLQRLLRYLRTEPSAERFVLFTLQPGRRWILAKRTGETGRELKFFTNKIYDDLDQAEWDVFKLRWTAKTGVEITDDV